MDLINRAPEVLPGELVGGVLEKLKFRQAPEPALGGLGTLFNAWSRNMPFDNVPKVIPGVNQAGVCG